MATKSRTKKLTLSCLACILAAACLLVGCSASPLPDPDDTLSMEGKDDITSSDYWEYGWQLNYPIPDFIGFPTLEDGVTQSSAIVCGRITGEPSAFKKPDDSPESPYEPCDLEDPEADCYQYTVRASMDPTDTYLPGDTFTFSAPNKGGAVRHPPEGLTVILLLRSNENIPGDLYLGEYPIAFSVDDSGHIKAMGISPPCYEYVGLSAADFWQSLVDYRNGDLEEIPKNPTI